MPLDPEGAPAVLYGPGRGARRASCLLTQEEAWAGGEDLSARLVAGGATARESEAGSWRELGEAGRKLIGTIQGLIRWEHDPALFSQRVDFIAKRRDPSGEADFRGGGASCSIQPLLWRGPNG